MIINSEFVPFEKRMFLESDVTAVALPYFDNAVVDSKLPCVSWCSTELNLVQCVNGYVDRARNNKPQ